VRGACEVANGVLVGQRLSGHQVRAPHGHQGARAAQPLAWQWEPGRGGVGASAQPQVGQLPTAPAALLD